MNKFSSVIYTVAFLEVLLATVILVPSIAKTHGLKSATAQIQPGPTISRTVVHLTGFGPCGYLGEGYICPY
jgi:hypothetical protein